MLRKFEVLQLISEYFNDNEITMNTNEKGNSSIIVRRGSVAGLFMKVQFKRKNNGVIKVHFSQGIDSFGEREIESLNNLRQIIELYNTYIECRRKTDIMGIFRIRNDFVEYLESLAELLNIGDRYQSIYVDDENVIISLSIGEYIIESTREADMRPYGFHLNEGAFYRLLTEIPRHRPITIPIPLRFSEQKMIDLNLKEVSSYGDLTFCQLHNDMVFLVKEDEIPHYKCYFKFHELEIYMFQVSRADLDLFVEALEKANKIEKDDWLAILKFISNYTVNMVVSDEENEDFILISTVQGGLFSIKKKDLDGSLIHQYLVYTEM